MGDWFTPLSNFQKYLKAGTEFFGNALDPRPNPQEVKSYVQADKYQPYQDLNYQPPAPSVPPSSVPGMNRINAGVESRPPIAKPPKPEMRTPADAVSDVWAAARPYLGTFAMGPYGVLAAGARESGLTQKADEGLNQVTGGAWKGIDPRGPITSASYALQGGFQHPGVQIAPSYKGGNWEPFMQKFEQERANLSPDLPLQQQGETAYMRARYPRFTDAPIAEYPETIQGGTRGSSYQPPSQDFGGPSIRPPLEPPIEDPGGFPKREEINLAQKYQPLTSEQAEFIEEVSGQKPEEFLSEMPKGAYAAAMANAYGYAHQLRQVQKQLARTYDMDVSPEEAGNAYLEASKAGDVLGASVRDLYDKNIIPSHPKLLEASMGSLIDNPETPSPLREAIRTFQKLGYKGEQLRTAVNNFLLPRYGETGSANPYQRAAERGGTTAREGYQDFEIDFRNKTGRSFQDYLEDPSIGYKPGKPYDPYQEMSELEELYKKGTPAPGSAQELEGLYGKEVVGAKLAKRFWEMSAEELNENLSDRRNRGKYTAEERNRMIDFESAHDNVQYGGMSDVIAMLEDEGVFDMPLIDPSEMLNHADQVKYVTLKAAYERAYREGWGTEDLTEWLLEAAQEQEVGGAGHLKGQYIRKLSEYLQRFHRPIEPEDWGGEAE